MNDTNRALLEMYAGNIECDGNHGGRACPDPKCWLLPGNNLHAAGIKDDKGKPDVGTLLSLCARAIFEMANVADAGTRKYVEGGWLQVPDGFKRYSSAMQRHYLLESIGEEFDEDGLMHTAQVAVNALYRLELKLREQDVINQGEVK